MLMEVQIRVSWEDVGQQWSAHGLLHPLLLLKVSLRAWISTKDRKPSRLFSTLPLVRNYSLSILEQLLPVL